MVPGAGAFKKKHLKMRFQPKFNIRKGDSVIVIAGDDKNRSVPRQVLAVSPTTGKVIVEGVNIVTKHKKPTAQNPQGGIVKEEAPIQMSNVMLWDASTKSGGRVKRTRTETGFTRTFKKSGQEIK